MECTQTPSSRLPGTEPIPRAVARVALPSVAGQIVMVLYQMADTFFVARTGSDAMIAAVTVCMPAFMILSAIANLFGIGGAGAMARALGAKLPERFQDAEAFALWGCGGMTAVYSLLVLLGMNPLLDLLGGWEPRVHALARSYLLVTVVLGGLGASLSGALAHLLRARGRSLHASLGVSLGGVLNIALDPLFMFVLLPRGREALGAAVATALSNLCSLCYLSKILLDEKRGPDQETAPSLFPRKRFLQSQLPREILATGLPAFLMTVMENVSCAVLEHLMGLEGLTQQAGAGVAKKLNLLAHSLVRGMAQGVLPLLAYHYAAGERKRMYGVLRFSLTVSVGLALLCTGAGLLFGQQLTGLFLEADSASRADAALFLRILCLGAPWSAAAYGCISFFQATGHSLLSFVLACARKGALDIPLMFLLRAELGAAGIVWATPAADALCCLLALSVLWRFVRRKPAEDGLTP